MSVSGILLILVVVAIIFLAFKLLPPYISNYQLQDSLNSIARAATYNYKMTPDEVRGQVMSEAHDLGVPIEETQVDVQKTGVSVSISVRYSVPVDLLVHQVVLNFEPSAGNRNIIAKP
jgi:hypothetical protein